MGMTDRQIASLRRENDELRTMHQLDMAEIVRLRRWIQALEEEREAPPPASPPPEKQRVWREYQKREIVLVGGGRLAKKSEEGESAYYGNA